MTIENPFSLEGKTILITGASSGIGRATAIECSKLGATTILVGRNEERLIDTYKNLSNQELQHQYFVCDLSNNADVETLCNTIVNINGLVLCAGINKNAPIPFCSREKFNNIFDINYFSAIEILRLLFKKKVLLEHASVVAIASIGGIFKYTYGNAIYGASKSALNATMKYAAREFANKMIRVNTICPGMVETPFINNGTVTEEQHHKDMEAYPLKRYGHPKDIAYGVVYLLSDAASWITGQNIVIDGGITIV